MNILFGKVYLGVCRQEDNAKAGGRTSWVFVLRLVLRVTVVCFPEQMCRTGRKRPVRCPISVGLFCTKRIALRKTVNYPPGLFLLLFLLIIKTINRVEETKAIKPGPKPKKDDGTDDRRRYVDPPNRPKHPTLPQHIHKPGEKR